MCVHVYAYICIDIGSWGFGAGIARIQESRGGGARRWARTTADSPHSLHPAPYTLPPTPYTLLPTSYSLHSTPYTLHPDPKPSGSDARIQESRGGGARRWARTTAGSPLEATPTPARFKRWFMRWFRRRFSRPQVLLLQPLQHLRHTHTCEG
jgi:hypothetical protein